MLPEHSRSYAVAAARGSIRGLPSGTYSLRFKAANTIHDGSPSLLYRSEASTLTTRKGLKSKPERRRASAFVGVHKL